MAVSTFGTHLGRIEAACPHDMAALLDLIQVITEDESGDLSEWSKETLRVCIRKKMVTCLKLEEEAALRGIQESGTTTEPAVEQHQSHTKEHG